MQGQSPLSLAGFRAAVEPVLLMHCMYKTCWLYLITNQSHHSFLLHACNAVKADDRIYLRFESSGGSMYQSGYLSSTPRRMQSYPHAYFHPPSFAKGRRPRHPDFDVAESSVRALTPAYVALTNERSNHHDATFDSLLVSICDGASDGRTGSEQQQASSSKVRSRQRARIKVLRAEPWRRSTSVRVGLLSFCCTTVQSRKKTTRCCYRPCVGRMIPLLS